MRRLLAVLLLTSCSDDASSTTPPAPTDSGVVDSFVPTDTAPEETSACVGTREVVDPKTASEVTVAGDTGSMRGIFDPSIVYPKGAPGGVMAYSTVPSQDAIFSRIALSNDKGATWTYVADANKPVDVAGGRLIHEVSSLVLDPTDVAARRFKLFVHSYVAVPGTDPVELHYDWGHIALYTAEKPEGPWSSPEKLLGWSSKKPAISSDGATQNLSTIPDLAKCVAFTEPGGVATETTIELALGCVELAAPTPTIRVVLLRSIDHARTFTLVSTLLRSNEASCVSSVPQLNAAHLFGANGKVFVAASTAGTVAGGFTGYNGCVTFELDDLARGTIKPGIVRAITAAENRFSGACSYAEETGWVLSTLVLESAPRTFRMFRGGAAP